MRTLDGIADDWPIDYWTLEPYFAENDRMTGVAGLAGDPAYPPHQPCLPFLPELRCCSAVARQIAHVASGDSPTASITATEPV